MLSILLDIFSEVEFLDHGVLRVIYVHDGENVHILRNVEVILAHPWFSVNYV